MVKSPLTKSNIAYLVQKYDLDLLVLFGSYAGGKTWEHSDLDVAFLSKHEIDSTRWDDFMCDLMRLTRINRIDLIDLQKQRAILLQYQIYTMGKCLYESKPSLFQMKRFDAQNFYWDYKDAYKSLDAIIQRKLNNLQYA